MSNYLGEPGEKTFSTTPSEKSTNVTSWKLDAPVKARALRVESANPFPALRPPRELAARVSSLPYDVMNHRAGLGNGPQDMGDAVLRGKIIFGFVDSIAPLSLKLYC